MECMETSDSEKVLDKTILVMKLKEKDRNIGLVNIGGEEWKTEGGIYSIEQCGESCSGSLQRGNVRRLGKKPARRLHLNYYIIDGSNFSG